MNITAALDERENVIMLFKSPAELQRDWHHFSAKANEAWNAIWREYGLTKAALKGDTGALAKAAASDVALAKIEATRLRSERGDLFAENELHLQTLLKARDWLNDYNRKNAEHNRLAKRSERFAQRLGQHR